MKNLFLIKNQEVFQGRKKIKKKENYFEGWYFKNTIKNTTISFIPGISKKNKNKEAFIQVITNNNSYYIKYDFDCFEYGINPFYIKIANNYFTDNYIHIDINDKSQNLRIFGNLDYTNHQRIETSPLTPNIMGPFSYIPFMECNHAILTLKATTNGSVKINNQKINFKNGISYVEKDWGISFPNQYFWCQANTFNSNSAFMISIANIPFKIFKFKGFICILKIDSKEYRFTTYNGAKIKKCNINSNYVDILLKKGKYQLVIKATPDVGKSLIAPVKGAMEKEIIESISSKVIITLKKDNEIIFKDVSLNAGIEIVL